MEYNIRNTVVSMPQSWNWLEDRRNKNDEMSRWVWKAIESKADEARIVKIEGEEIEERKNTKSKEGKI